MIKSYLGYRIIISLAINVGLVTIAYVGSFYLRLDLDVSAFPSDIVLKTLPLLIVVRMLVLMVFRLHRGLWQYVSIFDLMQIIQATTVGTLLFVILEISIFGLGEFPRSVFILDWVGNIFLLSATRLAIRLLRERFWPMMKAAEISQQRLLIIGAGDAGAQLCKQAQSNKVFGVKPVAFVDDDSGKLGRSILGVPIVGRWSEIPQIVNDNRIDIGVIAAPSVPPRQKRALLQVCRSAGISCKILSSTSELLDRVEDIVRVRDIDVADLLGRPQATLDRLSIQRFFVDKRVLITGAAGSIGSELARIVAGLRPGLLILVDHAENSLFFLEAEIQGDFPNTPLVVRVGDATDQIGMMDLMLETKPQVVLHAAAHKHVPLMERTPVAAVMNNVGGTHVMSKVSREVGVETFVLVSTDKAVNPTSVMGVTKRLSELLVQAMDKDSTTNFVTVRFGNVLGSNASVIPIFKQQIANGGPVTVTDPDIERYFMSISEAAGLILQAGSVGSGGQIFVLDMGDPVKIVDLAKMVIMVAGLEPHEDIDIVYTGMRPGEKISEELHFDSEDFETTIYDKLLVLKEKHTCLDVLHEVESLLDVSPMLEPDKIKLKLRSLIPEYRPETSAVVPRVDTPSP